MDDTESYITASTSTLPTDSSTPAQVKDLVSTLRAFKATPRTPSFFPSDQGPPRRQRSTRRNEYVDIDVVD